MNYTLQFRRKTQNEALILLVLGIFLSLALLTEVLRIPSVVKYVIDVVWLLLFVTIAINRFRMPNTETHKLFHHILVFWMVTLIGFAINADSPLYYLWGFRNNFRFFIYFFACTMFLREQIAEEILSAFKLLYYLNFMLTLFQYFVLGKRQDYLGGIFGTSIGCNSKTLIFVSIMVAYSALRYMNGKEKLGSCLWNCSISVVIAALAEIKGYYILFLLIIATASLLTDFSVKKLRIIIFSAVAIVLGISLLIRLFPQFEDSFSIQSMFETVSSEEGYTGKNDMNRLTTIPIVWNRFLNTWSERLLGLGMGNCDTSAFSFLNTAFFEKYSLLHYNWFSTSFMFLETGIIGFIMYVLVFVLIFVNAHKREKNGKGMREWCQLGQLMSLVSLALIIYNASMRAEEAYMVYFVLALPFINIGHEELSPKEAFALD